MTTPNDVSPKLLLFTPKLPVFTVALLLPMLTAAAKIEEPETTKFSPTSTAPPKLDEPSVSSLPPMLTVLFKLVVCVTDRTPTICITLEWVGHCVWVLAASLVTSALVSPQQEAACIWPSSPAENALVAPIISSKLDVPSITKLPPMLFAPSRVGKPAITKLSPSTTAPSKLDVPAQGRLSPMLLLKLDALAITKLSPMLAVMTKVVIPATAMLSPMTTAPAKAIACATERSSTTCRTLELADHCLYVLVPLLASSALASPEKVTDPPCLSSLTVHKSLTLPAPFMHDFSRRPVTCTMPHTSTVPAVEPVHQLLTANSYSLRSKFLAQSGDCKREWPLAATAVTTMELAVAGFTPKLFAVFIALTLALKPPSPETINLSSFAAR